MIHEQGLVAVLKTLHDELDRAVLDAYGWGDLGELMEVVHGNKALPHPNPFPGGEGAPLRQREEARRALDDALLERLVALNAARVPLKEDAIAACFTGRGAWKKRLPQIIDTLVAVGRVRRDKGGLAVTA